MSDAFSLSSVVDVTMGPGVSAATRSTGRTAWVVDGAVWRLPSVRSLPAPVDEVVEIGAGEPSIESVETVLARVRRTRADTVVAIGGGATIDTAKVVAALMGSNTAPVDHLVGALGLHRSVSLVAVPTTAGSGAEVTRTCVLVHEGRKSWMWDQALRPDRVLLDPELTVSLPEGPTVATGLDALVHAIEAYTNRHHDPVGEQAALAALAVIPLMLPRVVTEPGDVAARGAMLAAATTAGVAIDRNNTALAHCVGHALAAFSSIPHGLAVAVGLRATIAWSAEADPARFAAVADAMRPGAGADDLPSVLDEIFESVGFAGHVSRFADDRPDAELLAVEMGRPENRPMATAGIRPVEELLEPAEMVIAGWPT